MSSLRQYGITPLTFNLSAVGTSAVIDLGAVYDEFGYFVSVSGSPTSFSVQLEGSVDGTNFGILGSAITATGLYFVTGSPVRYVRANLTALTGGTSPVVTVTCLAKAT